MPDASFPTGHSAQSIAERGEAIYAEKYRAELEQKAHGKFVAVHIESAEATLGHKDCFRFPKTHLL